MDVKPLFCEIFVFITFRFFPFETKKIHCSCLTIAESPLSKEKEHLSWNRVRNVTKVVFILMFVGLVDKSE
jgi:hypothetical protein